MEGGTAIADVLSGEINPSGRLPITYPRFPNALFTYDYKAYDDRDLTAASTTFKPQFAFGSGSSYTTFEYAGLTTDGKATTFDQGIDVSVTVRNTGKRAGTEVVQLFVSDRVASVTPPIKRLKRFARVDLAAGRLERSSIPPLPATTCRSSTPAGVRSPSRARLPSRSVAWHQRRRSEITGSRSSARVPIVYSD